MDYEECIEAGPTRKNKHTCLLRVQILPNEPKLKYTNLTYSNLISISLVTLKKLYDIFKFENRNDIPPCNTVGPVEL